MLAHPLHALFYPQTIAVVGASDRYNSVGRAVFSYLTTLSQVQYQYDDMTIIPINPRHQLIGGLKCYENLAEASQKYSQIDLAVVILAVDKISGIVREAAKANIKQLVIINELDQPSSGTQYKLERAAEQARKLGIQLLMLPYHGLSGLFQKKYVESCVYIGQSRGIADCMKTYAQERGIEFSRFLTINPQKYAISMGQVIDFIASESTTTAILLHINQIDNARELISAITAIARSHPVVVLTTLSNPEEDMFLHQALERNHILTVQTLTQFFTATKLIHTNLMSQGKRLTLISNSPQIGALALNNLANLDLELATPSPQTTRQMGKIFIHKPSKFNPLYLSTDTPPSVFKNICELALQDENSDAVLFMYAGLNSCEENQNVAKMISSLQAKFDKPLLLVWLGSAETEFSQNLFNQNHNLHFKQPEHALHALSQLNYYRHYQQNRHRITSAFHDYRVAADVARDLRLHLIPNTMLPIAVFPATRNNIHSFFQALNLDNQTQDNHKTQTQLMIQWVNHSVFGQIIHLQTLNKQVSLLPPLTPDMIANALSRLNLPIIIWQDWLLNAIEIFTRVPEIYDTRLDVFHDVKKGIACREIRLNIKEMEHEAGYLNLYAPYPFEMEKTITLKNKEVVWLRPIRPEDALLIQRLIVEQAEESRYNRFLSHNPNLPPALLSHLSRPDYQREFALIMHDDEINPLATANYIADKNMLTCEFGISVSDDFQGQGIGYILMNELIYYARLRGFQKMRAEILADNFPMQKLALKLGFILSQNPDDANMVNAVLDLQELN